MQQDTGQTPVRVSPERARDAARRLRVALTGLGVPPDITELIVPWETAGGSDVIRLGTWDPAAVVALADALEATAPRPPLIGRPDAPPLLPAES